MKNDRKSGAIILAAGRGKRMQSRDVNKVTLHLADKPIILHAIHLLEELHFVITVVVVGFAKHSVMNLIDSPMVVYADQKKRLGTAHAVKCGLAKLPDDITDVLIIQGDDSAFYKKNTIVQLM